MPYTIYCPSQDNFPAQCFGVFETATLAERHGNRVLRHRKKVYLVINEPLQPENMLSINLLRRSSNFALTVLRNTKKAEKEGYFNKAIEDLEEALVDRPEPEIMSYRWRIHHPDGNVTESFGTTEQDAIRQMGFPEEVITNWERHFSRVENRGVAA